MKRKTAVCKCGRAVESTTITGTWYDGSTGFDVPWMVYRISCPCGIKTEEWPSPRSAWAEWKRLQEANDGK